MSLSQNDVFVGDQGGLAGLLRRAGDRTWGIHGLGTETVEQSGPPWHPGPGV